MTVGHQYTIIHDHLFSVNLDGLVDPTGYVGGPGNHLHLGNIVGMTTELWVTYSPLSRVGVSAGAAYVSSRYRGLAAEGPDDDGHFHSDFQDLNLGLRYMQRWEPIVITPILGATIPMTNYNNFGHAAVGRGLHQYSAGVLFGATMGSLLPDAFLQAGYERIFVEDVDDFSLDRNRFSIDAGYFVTPALSARGFFRYVDSKDGIDWFEDLSTPEGVNEHFGHHDVAAKELVRSAGGSLSYSLTDRIGLGLNYIGVVSGANTHAGRSVELDTSWSFKGPSWH